jgi:hypothetical protein
MKLDGFIGPSYTLDSRSIDSQRCVNLYPKVNELGKGKERQVASLIGTPGLRLLTTLENGPIRGSYRASNGLLYVVSGEGLYYVNSSFTGIKIGDLETSTGVVDFADNGTTLVIVDGPNGYHHTLGSLSLTQYGDASWLGSSKVGYIDSYFMFNDPNTGVFYHSNLNSTVIDALDFANAEGAPDNIVSTLINHREVWLFGEDSIEVWYNSGAADFPFERVSGGFIEFGCAAAHSVAKIEKMNFWLGRNKEGHGIVYAAQGLAPQRISTHAVELAIQSYGDISDATAWTYQENGHSFYVLNFTSANTSWVYDLSTRLWHERAYLNGGDYKRHRANCHSFAYNTHIVGDYENGNLYALESNYYTDNGQELRRMRIAPHMSNDLKRIQYHSFQLDAEVGVGSIEESQGNDPEVILQFSNDGGFTWSNEKRTKLGKIGNYLTRVMWRRLGIARDRVFKVVISDPVKIALIGAHIEVEGLRD